MRVHSSTRYAAFAALVGALACAGNKAQTDEAAAARDTTSVSDTLGGQDQNQPGYRGMERDTAMAPTGQTPSDTFLQNQGTGQPQDTAGYSGAERVDTTGQPNPQAPTDTSGVPADTTAVDSTQVNPSSSGVNGLDSTGASPTSDTTGYNPSQQSRDTTSR